MPLLVGFILGLILIIHGPVEILKITSGSMEPALKVGDLCVINRTADFSRLKVGEIVVFLYGNNSKACHRIVEKRDGGFVTKGDNNDIPDIFLLTRENFYGKLVISI